MLFSSGSSSGGGSDEPDLAPVKEVVSNKIWRATIDGSAQLDKLGIRHALIGGLAVGSYGFQRSTGDVDFLVADEAWNKLPSGLVTPKAGLPIGAHGVNIDLLSIDEDEDFLAEALDESPITEGVPVVPWETLVYLKLKASRPKDRLDVITLLCQGSDPDTVRSYLEEVAPKLLTKFEKWYGESLNECED